MAKLLFSFNDRPDCCDHFTLRTTLGVQNVCAHVVNKADVFPHTHAHLHLPYTLKSVYVVKITTIIDLNRYHQHVIADL